MSKKPLEVDFTNLKVDQLGFVFKNIEEQAKIMESVYGIPKFAMMEDKENVSTHRGKETNLVAKIGISRFINTQIELIEHVEGESIYKEFIDAGREGLHHISFFVDELDPYIEAFTKSGFEIVRAGQIGKQRFVYFDTEETFGLLLEFQETVRRRKKK